MKVAIFAPFVGYEGIEGKRALVPQGVRAPFYFHHSLAVDPVKPAAGAWTAKLLQFKVQ